MDVIPIPFSMLDPIDQESILIVYSDSQYSQLEVKSGLYTRFEGNLVMVEPVETH